MLGETLTRRCLQLQRPILFHTTSGDCRLVYHPSRVGQVNKSIDSKQGKKWRSVSANTIFDVCKSSSSHTLLTFMVDPM